jgi:hypothetical protein
MSRAYGNISTHDLAELLAGKARTCVSFTKNYRVEMVVLRRPFPYHGINSDSQPYADQTPEPTTPQR